MTLAGLKIEQLLNVFRLPTAGDSGASKGTDRFSGILKSAMQSSGGNATGEKDMNLRSLLGLKGEKFLNGLKSLLQEKGIDPNGASVNGTALNAIGRLLVSAGYDPKQVAALLQDFKAGSGKKSVRLSDLMQRISQLDEPSDPGGLLDTSSVPFIESILSMLLPEPEKQQLALNGVRLDGDRIDAARLASNLERIVQGSPDHGRSLPDPLVQRQVAKLMNGMGIQVQEGAVTLDRFVSELRAKIAGNVERLTEHRDKSAQLNRFMENIGPAEKGSDPRKPVETAKVGLLQKEAQAVSAGKAMPQGEAHEPEDAAGGRLMAAGESSAVKPAGQAAAPAGEAKGQGRTLPAYVVQQVSRQILHSHQTGTREIQLQLHPPNLGRIQVNIDATGDSIRVQIVTERQGAQELLASHTGDLKAVLSEQGLRLEKIDVQYDHFFDQALSDARQQHNRSRGQRQRESGGRMNRRSDAPDSVPGEESGEDRLGSADGLLDLVA